MVEVWLNALFILFILGAITALANWAERDARLRVALLFVLMGFNILLVIFPFWIDATQALEAQNAALATSDLASTDTADDDISANDLTAAVTLGMLGAGIITLFMVKPVRIWLGQFFPKGIAEPVLPPRDEWAYSPLIHNGRIELAALPHTPQAEPRQMSGFRPDSMMHVWAFALTLYFICSQLMSFALAGGLSGVAENIAIDFHTVMANFLPQVIIPLLGVGLFIRRNPRAVLERLGLRKPTWIGFSVSILAPIALIMLGFFVSLVWVAVAGEEVVREQTQASEALAESIDTLWLAFLVAFTAGVGEEIAFRGALQPIFGFWFTTIAFVIAHTQYTLTPASLVILAVAAAFGLIRKYLDTTTAILTHFNYNFALLLISLVAQQVVDEPAWLHFFSFIS